MTQNSATKCYHTRKEERQALWSNVLKRNKRPFDLYWDPIHDCFAQGSLVCENRQGNFHRPDAVKDQGKHVPSAMHQALGLPIQPAR